MSDEKKSWFQMAIGSMMQNKDKKKKSKNEMDKIKEASQKKKSALDEIYNYQQGK